MLVATLDQEMGCKWSVDDFGSWVNSNPQLKKVTTGWDLTGLWEGLLNEGLFMDQGEEMGRAAPALFNRS